MQIPYLLYCVLGLAFSFFYGLYAVRIWFRAPKLDENVSRVIRRDAWTQGWRDLYQHPQHFHQFWFNFVGSASGWAALWYAGYRLRTQPERFGLAEVSLIAAGLIGMCGYMPNMLHRIVGAIESVADLAKKFGAGAGAK